MERRLAAILASDVVDYTRLMGEDQASTLDALRQLRRELFEPVVGEYKGTVVKRLGDGWIVEFASISDAVECALRIHNGLADHDIIRMRTGIHIGDVVFEEEDVFGDGVNVAARLEELAAPGEVLISDTAQQSLDGKAAVQFGDGGVHQLKNVVRSVQVWRWSAATGREAVSVSSTDNAQLALPDKPSVAVLPFDNMSGDPEQEYFADGMAEDIITDLSKIAGLFVIARNSSFAYKGQKIDIPTVAGELNINYVLEGSVRRGGNRVRINAQLIDAKTGGHLWAERYDRDLTDIFAVQDEVTANIVEALSVTLGEDEERRVGQKGTNNLAAYECMLRGRELWLRMQYDDNQLARQILEQAIEHDPGFGPAYAYLAQVHAVDYVSGWSNDPQASLELAHNLGKRGVELMPEDAHVHIAFGSTLLSLRRHDEAISEAKRAIELDTNYAHGYFELGWYLQYAGRAAESLSFFDKAVQLDPHHADQFLHFMAQAYFHLGRFGEAVELLQRRLVRNSQSDSSRMLLAACYGNLNQCAEAHIVWNEIKAINPEFSLAQRREVLPYKYSENFDQIVDGLRKAGLPE